MPITYAAHGDTFTAYHAKKDADYWLVPQGANVPTIDADASAISGSKWTCSVAASLFKGVVVMGGENLTSTNKWSILMRLKPNFSNLPPAAAGLFGGSKMSTDTLYWGLGWLNLQTNGTIAGRLYNDVGGQILNKPSGMTGVYSGFTTTNWYDFVFTFDGDTSTANFNIYLDGTLKDTEDCTAYNNRDVKDTMFINFCTNNNGWGKFDVDEIVIWDEVIDPSALSLTGNSRTAHVSVTAFNAASYTDPGITGVADSISYVFAGVTQTGLAGTYTDPGIANVLSGTSYIFNSSTLTGTYHDGSYTNPGASNVATGVSYIFNDTTITGTLVTLSPGSGPAGTLDIDSIKSDILTILEQANTTTASPVDLSQNLVNRRVVGFYKQNPERINAQLSQYPAVFVFVTGKEIELKGMVKNQMTAKREAKLELHIAGVLWNSLTPDEKADPADKDLEILMENIELTMRAYPDINGTITWQQPKGGVTYHTLGYDEQTHMRAGLITFEVKQFY